MSGRSYQGPPLDETYQPISEAPHWQGDGETVAVVDADLDAGGEVSVEDVPDLDGGGRPDTEGQTTLDQWGWST